MLVLGIQGSPRKKGNTEVLLSTFMKAAKKRGAQTRVITVINQNIEPCMEYTTCEKKGFCPIKDDMDPEIYTLLRQADVVVPAAPVFFYNVPAQLKAMIDRTQTLWARKYRLGLTDPKRSMRRGFILSQGATKGKNLFTGIDLTAMYFFDAVGAHHAGSLYYRGIENRGDMAKHPTLKADVDAAVEKLFEPYAKRKRILFACRENACRSQMAGAFAQYLGGERVEVVIGGSEPAEKIHPDMQKAMAEKGIDMGFRFPQSIDQALKETKPEIVVTMGCGESCPTVSGAEYIDWDLQDPSGKSMEVMRGVRDEIEKRVTELIKSL